MRSEQNEQGLDLRQLLSEAGLTEADVTSRVAEVDLLPDTACMVWMRWEIIPWTTLRGVVQDCTRRGKTDDEKLARALVKRCCKSIHGLTLNEIAEYGLLALSREQVTRLLAVACKVDAKVVEGWTEDEREAGGRVSLDGSADVAVWLASCSRPMRMRTLELQDTANVLAAEDALRKKRSAT